MVEKGEAERDRRQEVEEGEMKEENKRKRRIGKRRKRMW